jgi:hypothetical protein
VIKQVVALSCLVGSALALYNVYSDVAPVQNEAASVACGSAACAALIGMERTPIGMTFRFQVQRNKADTAQVRCTRSFLLVGDYTCTKEYGPR